MLKIYRNTEDIYFDENHGTVWLTDWDKDGWLSFEYKVKSRNANSPLAYVVRKAKIKVEPDLPGYNIDSQNDKAFGRGRFFVRNNSFFRRDKTSTKIASFDALHSATFTDVCSIVIATGD